MPEETTIFPREPKHISATHALPEGEYLAKVMGFEGGTNNGKYAFKVYLDVTVPNSYEPYRLWHYANARYRPGVDIANKFGLVCNSRYLSELDTFAIESNPDARENYNDGIPCTVILIQKALSTGKILNDVIKVLPAPKKVEQIILPNEPTQEEVPF